MTEGLDDNVRPLDLGAPDGRQTEAADAMAREISQGFSSQLKRVLPFLARQRAVLSVGEPAAPGHETLEPLGRGPSYLLMLRSEGGAWAALQLDVNAIGALLDGLFVSATVGEDEEEEEPPDDDEDGDVPERLTLAQSALLRRLSTDVAEPFVEAYRRIAGDSLERADGQSLAMDQSPQLPDDARVVDCTVGGPIDPWRVRLAFGTTALSAAMERTRGAGKGTAAMASAIARVPLDVVAELGRVTLKLSEVLGLRRGDTLRLPAAANDPVLVRVEGVAKFQAVPVISRGQIAVKIQSRYAE